MGECWRSRRLRHRELRRQRGRELIRSAKAFAAEVEREKFVERSVRGKRDRVGAGKLLHGKTPLYGYDWPDASKSRYVVNQATATVVCRMFDLSASGVSLRGIAKVLTDQGIATPRGAKVWDPVVIRNILRNSAYAGEAYAFRIKHTKLPGTNRSRHTERPRDEWARLPEGTIPAIVEPETFTIVQDRLRRNLEQSPRRLRNPEAYLLRGGYVRCGYCGNAMSAIRKESRGHESTVYQCTRRARSDGLCTHHNILTRILDDAVWGRVSLLLTRPDVIAQELERLRQNDPTEAECLAIDRALADVRRKSANLARALAMFDDEEAAAPVVAQLEALRVQERAFSSEREEILGRRSKWAAGQHRLADLQAWCRKIGARLDTLTYDQRRTALDALVPCDG